MVDAVLVGRERLRERVLVGRDDEEAVDVLHRQDQRAREHVRDVRRIEAASEDRDPAQDFTLQLRQTRRRESLASDRAPFAVVERRDDLVLRVVEHHGAPVPVARWARA